MQKYIFIKCFILDTGIDIYHNKNRKGLSKQEYNDVMMVEDFIKNNLDKSFLVIKNERDNIQRGLDTYCNYSNVYTGYYADSPGKIKQNISSFDFENKKLYLMDRTLYDRAESDYIILQKGQLDIVDKSEYNILVENNWYKIIEIITK